MSLVPHPGTPISIPLVVHLMLWPALLAWTLLLIRRRRSRAWPCSPRFGLSMVPGCLFVDAAAILAAVRWPSATYSFNLALLWLAALFSLTAYFALRTPGDGRDSDEEPEDHPEPPWWPDFERQFRDYLRRGPQRPPKTPAGVSS